jgi:hypothetical protein
MEPISGDEWKRIFPDKRWEKMEAWLFDNYEDRPGQFSSRDLAASLDVDNQEASRMIQAYLDAQRRSNASTLYVLKREGRTTKAVWSIGQRTADARVIGRTLFEDVDVKVRRAFARDLDHLAERNPRAAKYVEAKLQAVVDGALVVLAAAVDADGNGYAAG